MKKQTRVLVALFGILALTVLMTAIFSGWKMRFVPQCDVVIFRGTPHYEAYTIYWCQMDAGGHNFHLPKWQSVEVKGYAR